MFDLKDLRPFMQTDDEKKFLEVLIETSRAIYDWGYDCLWVWTGDLSQRTKENSLVMMGEDFHERLYAAFGEALNWPTQAGFVVDLLACGVNVDVGTKEPFLPWYLASLVRCATEENPGGKIGVPTEFIAKYESEEPRE